MKRFNRWGMIALLGITLTLISCENESYKSAEKDILPAELELDYEQAGRFHQYMKALNARKILMSLSDEAYDTPTLYCTIRECKAAKDKSPEQIQRMLLQVSEVIRSSISSPPDCLDIYFSLGLPGESTLSDWNFPCPLTEP
jgi:hypothetical protein